MENVGALAILLAFCFAIYAVFAAVTGKLAHRPFLAASAERAVYSVWALLSVAAALLIFNLIKGDFRMAYVWEHSNTSMPLVYKFAAWWGGQEGSLLLWAWLLAGYTSVVTFQNRRKFRDMMPYVTAVLMSVETFFLILISFVESPFKMLMAGKGVIGLDKVADGNGLNPLLQYWTMAIHPPMLYLGYVGFAVPFAFAVGSLISKQPGEAWIHTTRRWTLVTWGFQTTGVLLGAGWAYAVLGWGGYWAWDPVENASLLPWITATAFLHSVMMQEKKGMMKVWNMVLVSATFWLCIFGTSLTRTGIVQSVHAFAQSPLSPYFVWFEAVGIAATLYLILNRMQYLKSEAPLESVLSRESSFMFNNLLLLAACFAVLWGTLFPVITEHFNGEKISVDKPFFDRINIPIGLGLMLLTGVGPLIAWRRSSVESLKRAFAWPLAAGAIVAAGLFAMGIHHPYALMSFLLCTFVAVTIVIEFFKGASAIRAKSGANLLSAMVELTHRNTRRYGGYIVHMGIVFMFIGFTGSAFNQDLKVELGMGQTAHMGRYALKLVNAHQGQNSNYRWQRIDLDASKDGTPLGILEPERRFYIASNQPTSEVSIRRRLNEDLYVNFAGVSDTSNNAMVLDAYVFPLVSWIWIGYWVVLAGTIVCLIPSKSKLVYPRTEVVAVADKHARVEN
ncbi:MAG TPA: heme lyase CcmF/NrfE family subunit [Bryobacteraceae bacterium]